MVGACINDAKGLLLFIAMVWSGNVPGKALVWGALRTRYVPCCMICGDVESDGAAEKDFAPTCSKASIRGNGFATAHSSQYSQNRLGDSKANKRARATGCAKSQESTGVPRKQ